MVVSKILKTLAHKLDFMWNGDFQELCDRWCGSPYIMAQRHQEKQIAPGIRLCTQVSKYIPKVTLFARKTCVCFFFGMFEESKNP